MRKHYWEVSSKPYTKKEREIAFQHPKEVGNMVNEAFETGIKRGILIERERKRSKGKRKMKKVC